MEDLMKCKELFGARRMVSSILSLAYERDVS